MPDPKDDEKPKKPAAPAPDASADAAPDDEGTDGGGGDDLFDDADVTGDESEGGTGGAHSTAPEAAADPNVTNVIQQASAAISELGLEVPPDTTDALEFLKHVITAAKTHKSTRDKVASEAATAQTGQDAMGGETNEEQRPYLMSTALISEKLKTVTDPEQKRMLLSLQALTAKAEKDRLASEKATAADCLHAVERMVKRGLRPSHAKRFRDAIGQPTGYQLATGTKGVARQKRLKAIKFQLSLLNDHLPGITDDLLRANAVEQPKPGQRGPDDDKNDANHMIRLAGLTPLAK